MSVCLEHNTVLASAPVGTSASDTVPNTTLTPTSSEVQQQKNVTKLIVTNNASTVVNNTTTVIPKLVSQPLITVLNSPGPLTVVKSLCVTSGVTSAPQFTLVNSTPLTVTNATGKSTITLLNAPVALVKAVPAVNTETREVVASGGNVVTSNNGTDKPAAIHNVFVKNTCAPDLVQEAKFSAQTIIPASSVSPPIKTVNGQKPTGGSGGKVKILSNVVMSPAGAGPSNILLNKTNMQRYIPRQKVISNGATVTASPPTTTKYINKPPLNNTVKSALPPIKMEKMAPQRPLYPTHKGQIKTLAPVNSYLQKNVSGIKTLPPQKGMPGHVQRTNAGIRTIPPQRPSKPPNKPNYIGKHAVQAQKIRSSHHSNKIKSFKPPPPPSPVSSYHNRLPQNSTMNFNQALTAEIIQTLSHESGPSNSYSLSKNYDLPPSSQYDSPPPAFMESREVPSPVIEEKPYQPSSGLNTLSLICHAVYLDHNYNATMPPDSPTRNSPPANTSPQINGLPGSSLYSPGSATKRLRPSPNNNSSNIMPPVVPTLSTASLLPPVTPGHSLPEEDAASDVSCLSDRKPDTEGEETDTAPEAEAVNNDDQFDHYGDYVTRCICGFLHDDGYMIECDRCKVWQHVRCVVRNKQVPDEYLCEVCDSTKSVDRHKARLLQQQWMRETQIAMEAKLRKEAKLNNQLKHNKDALTESDSSDGEHVGKSRVTSSRRKDNQKPGNSRLRRDSGRDTIQKRPNKRKDRKMVKRKAKSQAKSQSDEDNSHDPWINSQLPQLRQWIDNYEEAVTNHYSPELRARISNIRINGAHSDLSTQMEPGVQKCRIHLQPLTGLKYLVSTTFLPPDTPVVELRGKYMLSTQHRNSGGGGSLTTRQHAQRPGPFLFFYRLHNRDNTEVCVDTRTYGNSARFVRRSCRPNAELRHCIEKGVLHLYIVTVADVERNVELTIKHESHDLAAVGTTHIACACGSPDECLMNKTTSTVIKKNGEKPDTNTTNHRKRRSRRTNSPSGDQEVPQRSKEATPPPPSLPSPPPPPPPPAPIENSPDEIKQEVEEVKQEPKVEDEEIKTEEVALKEEVKEEIKKEENATASVEEEEEEDDEKEKVVKKEKEEQLETEEDERETKSPTPPPPPPPPVTTRRSSHRSSEPEDKKEPAPPQKDDKKNKKLSREERKIEAYMKAFERMEKLQQRRQEHQAKQAHRRESEPGPGKDDEKTETKAKRRKRKGRARTTSTNSQTSRRNRLNSADSSYATSGDEQMLSPNDNTSSRENLATSKENSRDAETGSPDKAVGLLLSLANGDTASRMEANIKTPPHDIDSNSNSAHSSPETPLSSACLLVAAAVGPLEPGFKFPKTKKGLMNEWLNKTDIQSASAISPSSLTPHIHSGSEFDTNTGFYAPVKNLANISQSGPSGFCESSSNVEPRGSAKKRWLRQAISEDQCDSPNSRPDSPPISEAVAAPPKKRRLPRESLSNNASPPTTPTSITAPPLPEDANKSSGSDEGRVEIVYSGTEGDSPTQTLESDAVLKERAAEMQQEFAASLRLPEPPKVDHLIGTRFLMDPRLRRDAGLFTNSEHLVGTVEKTLSFLGYEDRKPENITPAKRKLSITEYRQRKKLNNNDKVLQEDTIVEENNLSQSPKQIRRRSNSSSSITSFASSDEEAKVSDIPDKAPAFNSEPTELELQRENVGLRLKKAFGLSVDEDSRKPALNMETLLNCELPPVVKTTPRLPSPTFPIPGSSEPPSKDSENPEQHEEQPLEPSLESKMEVEEQKVEEDGKHPVLYYTPDDEEVVRQGHTKEPDEIDGANSVALFNDPTYPSTSYTSLTSTIDDDTRYEGRNPSPPPEHKVSVSDAGPYQVT